MASLVVWLTFMGLAALLVAARVLGRLPRATFVALALAAGGRRPVQGGDGRHARDPHEPRHAAVDTPGSSTCARSAPNRFVGIERALGPSPLIPDMSMRWDLYDARSYDLPVEERYDTLWRARGARPAGPTDTPTTSARLTARRCRRSGC